MWRGSRLVNPRVGAHIWRYDREGADNGSVHLPGLRADLPAIQKPQRDDRAGEYNCAPCKTNIHTWSGRYDYDDWQTFGTGTKH